MLSRFSVKKPYTVFVVIALVVVLGVVSLTRMSTDLLPSMNMPYAIVVTTYAGASPEEVEMGVTKPIESAMATTSNIKHMNSVSAENYSMVVLEFEQSANMDSVTIEMRESLDQITGYFPDAVGNPVIMKINPDMLPIMIAAVDVDGMNRTEISQYVEEDLIAEIESTEGVASVSGVGVIEEKIQVVLNQDKIDKVNKKIEASLDDSFADAEAEMEEARDEIQSGKEELEAGQQQLADSVSETQNQLNDKKVELMLTESDLNAQLAELKNTKAQLEEGISGIEKLQEGAQQLQKGMKLLEGGIEKLQAGMDKLQEALDQLEPAITAAEAMTEEMLEAAGINLEELYTQQTALQQQYDELKKQRDELQRQYDELKKQEEALKNQITELGAQMGKENLTLEKLPELKKELEMNLTQVTDGITRLEAALTSVAEGKTTINEALSELNRSQILGSIQMGGATAQITSGEEALKEAETTMEEQKESAYESASLDNILTMEMLQNILAAQNFSMPAGYVTEEKEQYLIRVGDKVADMEALSQLVLLDMQLEGVAPIKLSDVADVSLVNNEEEVYASINGNPGIMLSIEKQTGYSTGDVTDRVLEKFDLLESTEKGLHTTVLMDQGIYIDMIVDSVLQNMIVGGILAVLILLIFLKDIKPTFVIACSIPVSVIFAVVLMYFSGITLNVISLSGLALGIGMLVDNSIVVIENIYRMRSEGVPVKKAAVDGAKQVAGAIVASTLTTICVFAPIIFTEGITRQLFVDMGLTIAYSLLASLIIALTFVPMMSSKMLKKAVEKKHPAYERLKVGYGKMLAVLLRFKPVVFLVVIVLLAGSLAGAFSNGTAFMPAMESPQMTITITPPKEADLKEASALSEQVMERISAIEDIDTIGAMAGGQGVMSMGSGSGNEIHMYVILKDAHQKTNAQLTDEILSLTEDLEGEISVNSAAMDMSMLGGSGISVEIRGRDIEKLQTIAADITELLAEVPGVAEISDGLEETMPQLKISVDKEKAASYNMTVAQVFQLVADALGDEKQATTISTDLKDYDVYVAAKSEEEVTRKEIQNLTFTYTDKEGKEEEIPLSEIASFSETEGLTAINRDAQERYITVNASIDEEHNVGLVGREVQKRLDKYSCPAGYSLEMIGEDETINEAISQVMLMMILAVIFVYLIMVAQFQSLLSPFIIMFTIPLAFTGGFLALFFTGKEVSVIALIGFVMLAGIIVNNGIVMVDYTNQLRKSGMEKREAIIEAGKTRLRPILMTALTTIIAMFGMALGLDTGSDMVQPMALVVVGGMIYGTLLTLIVIPCIYDAFNRNKSMVEEEF